MKLAYLPEAIKDLIQLREFITIKNPQAAERIAQLLLKKHPTTETASFNGQGCGYSTRPRKAQRFIAANYTVRYLLGSETIIVLRVWHQREDK